MESVQEKSIERTASMSDAVTPKKKNVHRKHAKIFWWQYINGKTEMDVCYYQNNEQTVPEKTDRQVFAGSKDCKVARKKLKAKLEKEGYTVASEKLDVLADTIRTVETYSVFSKEAQWVEFQKMLKSCGEDTSGNDAILKLVIWMVSGYFSKFVTAKTMALVLGYPHKAAPIVTVSKTINSREAVGCLAQTLAMKQDVKRGKAPVILPDTLGAETILDCAYARFGGKTKKACVQKRAVQYGPGCVLIQGVFFKKREIEEFCYRNYLTSIVVLGSLPKDNNVLKIPGDVLGQFELCWAPEAVASMIADMVQSVEAGQTKSGLEILHADIRGIEWDVFQYQERVGKKLKPIQLPHLVLALYTIDQILQHAINNKVLSQEEAVALQSQWRGVFLPAYDKASDVTTLKEPQPDPLSLEEQFEAVLSSAIGENWPENIQVVGENDTIDKEKAETNQPYWGYLKYHNWDEKPVLSLIIPNPNVTKAWEASIEAGVNADISISKVRKKVLATASYLHDKEKVQLWKNKDRKPVKRDCYILDVNQLTFLPEETVAALKAQFETKE